MGYFSNNDEGSAYEERYCSRCIHGGEDLECPVIFVHAMYAYKECGKGSNAERILNILIPRAKNGVGNEQCKMFVARTGSEEDESEDAAVLRIIETDKSIAEAFARFVAEPMSVKAHLTDWEFKLACEAPIVFEKYKGFTWKQRRSLRQIVQKIIKGQG
jgi:hypothetical protein